MSWAALSEQELVEAVAQAATEVLFPWSQMPFEGRIMAFQEAARYVTGLRNNPMLLLALLGIEEEYHEYDVIWTTRQEHFKSYPQEWNDLTWPTEPYSGWAERERSLNKDINEARLWLCRAIYQRIHVSDAMVPS